MKCKEDPIDTIIDTIISKFKKDGSELTVYSSDDSSEEFTAAWKAPCEHISLRSRVPCSYGNLWFNLHEVRHSTDMRTVGRNLGASKDFISRGVKNKSEKILTVYTDMPRFKEPPYPVSDGVGKQPLEFDAGMPLLRIEYGLNYCGKGHKTERHFNFSILHQCALAEDTAGSYLVEIGKCFFDSMARLKKAKHAE